MVFRGVFPAGERTVFMLLGAQDRVNQNLAIDKKDGTKSAGIKLYQDFANYYGIFPKQALFSFRHPLFIRISSPKNVAKTLLLRGDITAVTMVTILEIISKLSENPRKVIF